MSNDDFDKIPETVSISSDGATDDPDNSGFDQTNPDYFGNNTPDQLLIELEKALKLSDDVTELFINQLDKEREGISMIYILYIYIYIYHILIIFIFIFLNFCLREAIGVSSKLGSTYFLVADRGLCDSELVEQPEGLEAGNFD